MILQLRNNTDTLVLAKTFKISVDPLRKRVGIQKRFDKDGGVLTGDRKADPRGIDLNFNVINEKKDGDQSYFDVLNQLDGFFRPALAPFFLEDTENLKRTAIELESISDRNQAGLEAIAGQNKLDLKMIDAYWEDLTQIVVSSPSGGMVSGDTLIVNNTSLVDAFPVMTLAPDQLNTGVTITNEETLASYTLGSNSFVPGSTFIVSSVDGSIKLDNGVTQIENSIALADNSGFIKLQPGTNTLKYESVFGRIDLSVTFRKRFAF